MWARGVATPRSPVSIMKVLTALGRWGLTLLVALCLLLPDRLLALAPEDYQDRGNRSEGIKPKLVSGYDIELLSVMADFREAVTSLPKTLRVRFFLKDPVPVHLTIREQRYEHYYWLDHVLPSPPWQTGFNEFSWPTGDVLQRIDVAFPVENLGVVVRLNSARPSVVESVAPAILYHSTPPPTVLAYLFTMKPGQDARIKCEVYREGTDKPVWTTHVSMAVGDQPMSVRWDAKSAPAGAYRMLVTGYFLDNNQRFAQTIRFYHQPEVK